MPEPDQLLVTGASGWIGGALVNAALLNGIDVVPIDARHDLTSQMANRTPAITPSRATLIHLAGLAHRSGQQELSTYLEANRNLTVRLAEASVAAGLRRFVFVSSNRVMGDTAVDRWTEQDPPRPQDSYSTSKWLAEQALKNFDDTSALQVVIVRPPLVYGPGVKANFRRLLALADSDWPVPVSTRCAPRSMIALDNLVSALLFLALREQPTHGTYFVRDDRDWTTPDLLRCLRAHLGRTPRLVPLPDRLLRWAARLTGQSSIYRRMFEPSMIDAAALHGLGWSAPIPSVQALATTARWYAATEGHSKRSNPTPRRST